MFLELLHMGSLTGFPLFLNSKGKHYLCSWQSALESLSGYCFSLCGIIDARRRRWPMMAQPQNEFVEGGEGLPMLRVDANAKRGRGLCGTFFGMDGWHPRYSGPLIGPRRRLARITREIEEQMFSSAAKEFESGPDTNFQTCPKLRRGTIKKCCLAGCFPSQ